MAQPLAFDRHRMSAFLADLDERGLSREEICTRMFRGPRWLDRLIEHGRMKRAVARELAIATGTRPAELWERIKPLEAVA